MQGEGQVKTLCYYCCLPDLVSFKEVVLRGFEREETTSFLLMLLLLVLCRYQARTEGWKLKLLCITNVGNMYLIFECCKFYQGVARELLGESDERYGVCGVVY